MKKLRTVVSGSWEMFSGNLSAVERMHAMQKKWVLGGSLETVKQELQEEIRAEGGNVVKVKLAKERQLIDELSEQLEALQDAAMALVYQKIILRKQAGYEIDAAIPYVGQMLQEQGLDYSVSEPLQQTHDALLARQIILRDHEDLFDVAFDSDLYSQKKIACKN
jgi:predicted AlkP superfamily phosphohydrolase/phosphomutase